MSYGIMFLVVIWFMCHVLWYYVSCSHMVYVSCPMVFCFQETHGVCVISYGASKEFPSFFTPKSGFDSPYHVSNVQQAAHVIGESYRLQ